MANFFPAWDIFMKHKTYIVNTNAECLAAKSGHRDSCWRSRSYSNHGHKLFPIWDIKYETWNIYQIDHGSVLYLNYGLPAEGQGNFYINMAINLSYLRYLYETWNIFLSLVMLVWIDYLDSTVLG